jgi:alginate O-acetyltransferase complex protein AlgI
MLFQSPEFLFLFLPAVLAGLGLLRMLGWRRGIVAWLIVSSIVFYARWEPVFVLLILGSTTANYGFGRWLGVPGEVRRVRRSSILALGLAFNLTILGYFKYRGFFAENWNALFGSHFDLGAIVLPLGISFFSFQKIAYLVDVYRGTPPERNFANYLLFVLFFPQLIAGPIVHPGEFLPQARTAWQGRADWTGIRQGLVFFVLGLAKKVLLADSISRFVSPTFTWAAGGGPVGAVEGWTAALGYTLQLYFDFSGYTDMAIGLALCLGIRLPFNFNSPYRAHSIQEFWQRWHMTLSRFIRDYLYIPLGGNRGGLFFHYRNLILTMLIAGLWHGAGWHFVLWGGIHGLYLAIHHAWRRHAPNPEATPWWTVPATFLSVVVAWVLFRAETLRSAGAILLGMAGVHGKGFMPHQNLLGWLILGTAIVFLAPNSQWWAGVAADGAATPGTPRRAWNRITPLSLHWAAAAGLALLTLVCLLQIFSQPPSEFIYFNF